MQRQLLQKTKVRNACFVRLQEGFGSEGLLLLLVLSFRRNFDSFGCAAPALRRVSRRHRNLERERIYHYPKRTWWEGDGKRCVTRVLLQ